MTSKSKALFCRVSRSYEETANVFAQLTAKCSAVVVYEHIADNEISRTHVHFFLEDVDMSVEGIKKMFRKECGDLMRSDWAFNTKEVDRDCITYMAKGTLEPSFNRGGIDTSYYKELWEDRPKKSQAKLQFITKETSSEAKKRKNDLIAEIIVLVKDPNEDVRNETEDNKIVRCIIKILNDNKIVFGRYTIRDYYDTICSRTDPGKFTAQMINFCVYNR
uniref:Uncharacterized protein n=1 Tax=aquatic metagenome TaxID=1169740 RepID=A0A7D5BHI1_9ZZZZ